MDKSSISKRSLIGGNKAALVNPLGLTRKWKAVCITEGKYISTGWRNSKADAMSDAESHINKGHYVDYETKII